MSIVTLTTDFGHSDYYQAALKAALLTINDSIRIIDVTHEVNPYDIVRAAFVLSQVYEGFPNGTIHLVCVHLCYADRNEIIYFEKNGHHFIGPNNGVFSLMFPQLESDVVYSVPSLGNSLAQVQDSMANAVLKLSKEESPSSWALPTAHVEMKINLQPVANSSQIRGTIVHIDRYENAITNIHSSLFERAGKGRAFSIYYRPGDPITRISESYSHVPIGAPAAIFNQSGYLELAINAGSASSMLGIKKDETIQIDFHD